jgi:clan AA aspartic protease (TIGR02281 family)
VQCTRDYADLNPQLEAARKQGAFKYNQIVGRLRELDATRLEAARYAEAREKELSKLGDPSDDYIKSVIDVAGKMEALAVQYEALAADEEIKTALAAINQRGGLRMRLGPSSQFTSELPGVRKLREMVREAVIKLAIEGGVPQANVTINGNVTLQMVVDTGAASMTLTADSARKLGLKIDKSNPVIKMVLADGKPAEGRLVTLESVRLGQFSVDDVECVVYPANVAGMNLLGGTFLRNFICRVDLAARELHMTQVAGVKSPAIDARPSEARTKAPSDEAKLSAFEKRDKVVHQAQDAFDRALVAANLDLLRDLDEALKAAQGDAAAVAKLQAAKKQAEQEVARGMFRSGGKVVVQVNAVDDWTEFLRVRSGDVLNITATGAWSHNVNQNNSTYGPAGNAGGAYLEGKIGDKVYRIDTGTTISVEADGNLSMRMNDSLRGDNSGFVTVTIVRKEGKDGI